MLRKTSHRRTASRRMVAWPLTFLIGLLTGAAGFVLAAVTITAPPDLPFGVAPAITSQQQQADSSGSAPTTASQELRWVGNGRLDNGTFRFVERAPLIDIPLDQQGNPKIGDLPEGFNGRIKVYLATTGQKPAGTININITDTTDLLGLDFHSDWIYIPNHRVYGQHIPARRWTTTGTAEHQLEIYDNIIETDGKGGAQVLFRAGAVTGS